MTRRWQCQECGATVQRTRPPSYCRSCDAGGRVFVAAHELDGAPPVRAALPGWEVPGMGPLRVSARDRQLLSGRAPTRT
jgi:hypothetical protein